MYVAAIGISIQEGPPRGGGGERGALYQRVTLFLQDLRNGLPEFSLISSFGEHSVNLT